MNIEYLGARSRFCSIREANQNDGTEDEQLFRPALQEQEPPVTKVEGQPKCEEYNNSSKAAQFRSLACDGRIRDRPSDDTEITASGKQQPVEKSGRLRKSDSVKRLVDALLQCLQVLLDFFTHNTDDEISAAEKTSLKIEIGNISYMLNGLRDISQEDALTCVLRDEGFVLMRVSRFVFLTLDSRAILAAFENHGVKEFTLETIHSLKTAF